MPAQNFPRPLNQQLDKISDPIPTNDVLADALLVTETTYFKGSGSSYTGTVPSNNFKYGVFCVVKRNDASFIVHATSADGTSSNYYDGSAWGGWTPSTSALNSKFEEFTKTTPTLPTGVTSTDYTYSKIVKNSGSKIVHVDIYMTPTVNVTASGAFLQGFPVQNSAYGTNIASTLILIDYTNNTATRAYLLGDKLYTSSGLSANHLYMGGFTYFTT